MYHLWRMAMSSTMAFAIASASCASITATAATPTKKTSSSNELNVYVQVCVSMCTCVCVGAVSHLQLANRRRRESLVKLDDRVPFSVIFNFGRVFSEQRHEIVHEQNVTKNTAGLKWARILRDGESVVE